MESAKVKYMEAEGRKVVPGIREVRKWEMLAKGCKVAVM